ncbi:MAG: prepilin-type N-terminal cleavage/methylation domain-containing protein [bacterium]
MMNKRLKHILNHGGFTIIELMIATAIFSFVLIVLTENIISISGQYYQGLIQTQTLQTTKNIIQSISQNLQLNTQNNPNISLGPPPWDNTFGGSGTADNYESCFVIGNNIYIYQVGGYVVSNASNPLNMVSKNAASAALELYTSNTNVCPNPIWDFSKKYSIALPSSTTVLDLIPQNMRLVKLIITSVNDSAGKQIPNLYKIDVEVAYGDDNSFDINNNVCKKGVYLCAHTEIVTYVDNQG